jgi:hypothetical protein
MLWMKAVRRNETKSSGSFAGTPQSGTMSWATDKRLIFWDVRGEWFAEFSLTPEIVSSIPALISFTCGALLHGRELVIPYAMSDSATSFATVPLDELLGAME